MSRGSRSLSSLSGRIASPTGFVGTASNGYGQTETTAQIGNPPGARVKEGAMGRPLPGYAVTLVDPATDAVADEGEITLELDSRPIALMTGYRDSAELSVEVMRGGRYHTVTSRAATPTAISRTSAAPTTSSSPRTTGSRRSSSRAF